MQRSRKRVVFDVETIGCRWEDFSDEEREYLVEKAKKERGDEHTAQGKLALSPLTGELVLIGMLNPDTRKGRVHVRWPPSHSFPMGLQMLPTHPIVAEHAFGDLDAAASSETTSCGVCVWPDEASLLCAFWEDMAHYDQVISFNGRSFDGPIAMIRSMALDVPISRDLVPNRYYDEHIDLADRLTGYGAMRERYTLDFWCGRLGIPSPKQVMHGADVERVWRAGELAKLCAYNAVGDLCATAALFAKYAAAYGSVHRINAVTTTGATPADGAHVRDVP